MDGHITMPELPGIGFEGKSDLATVMREALKRSQSCASEGRRSPGR